MRIRAPYHLLFSLAVCRSLLGAPPPAPLPERLGQWKEKPAELRFNLASDGQLLIADLIRAPVASIIEARLYRTGRPFDGGVSVYKAEVKDPNARGLQISEAPGHRWMVGWRETTGGGASFKVQTLWPVSRRTWKCRESVMADPAMAQAVLPEKESSKPRVLWASTTDERCALKWSAIDQPISPVNLWDFPRESNHACELAPHLVEDRQGGWFVVTPSFGEDHFHLRVLYKDAEGASVWEQDLLGRRSLGAPEVKAVVWSRHRDLRIVWTEPMGGGLLWKVQVLAATGEQLLPEGGLLLHESMGEGEHAQTAVVEDGRLLLAWQDSNLDGTKVHWREWAAQALSGPGQEDEQVLAKIELCGIANGAGHPWTLFWLTPSDPGWALWAETLPSRAGPGFQ